MGQRITVADIDSFMVLDVWGENEGNDERPGVLGDLLVPYGVHRASDSFEVDGQQQRMVAKAWSSLSFRSFGPFTHPKAVGKWRYMDIEVEQRIDKRAQQLEFVQEHLRASEAERESWSHMVVESEAVEK